MRRAWLMAAVAALGCACGYRFVTPDRALLRGGQAFFVPVFANDTSEPGAEALFTQALRDALAQASALGGRGADQVLEGVVTNVASGPLLASPGRMPNYRLSASVVLRHRQGGRVVAEVTANGAEDFPAGADVLWLESNRAAALRRLADVVIRDGLDQLALQAQ